MPGDPVPEVGRRIRTLRELQGLSLRALSVRSGLSANAISLIERGENSPTVSSLHLLASALGVSIADLFEAPQQQPLIFVRAGERLRAQTNGILMESLGIGLDNQQLEPFLLTVAPGAGNEDEPITHPGEEFVFCLEGEVDYSVDGQRMLLRAGDSLLFQASLPHWFCNRSGAPARFMIVFQGEGRKHLARQMHMRWAKGV